ncbi:MAG: hypothetical protein MUE49_00395 [Rhodospirillales bacterium]|nr:hypothetical protein [Rhodospirillales bacterium]
MRVPILAALLSAAMAANAAAGETIAVDPAARSGLAVTVYGDGFAFVRDTRAVDLPKGPARLTFSAVSREMVAASPWLEAGKGVRVITLDQDFDVLTPDALLRRAVGGPVLVIRSHPQTGEDQAEPATLLAVEQGVVVRYRDRIETVPPGRLAFPTLPDGLSPAPTLSANVESAAAARQPLTLSYLTGGLGWSADYVVTLDEGSRLAHLAGRASVTNTTGSALTGASVGLIAGRVNRVAAPAPSPRAMRAEMMAAPADGAPPEREAVADLHLYRLAGTVNLDDRQTRQFPLLDIADLTVVRSYVSEGGGVWHPLRGVEPAVTHPRVRLAVTVPVGEGAQPFPAGAARIFSRDGKGELRLIGEDRVPATPAGGRIELEPGDAFDITVRRRQTDFLAAREPNAYTEAAWQISVDNAKDETVDVRVIERLAGDWKVLSETAPHMKEAADRIAWTVSVPARGKADLAYRVRLQR